MTETVGVEMRDLQNFPGSVESQGRRQTKPRDSDGDRGENGTVPFKIKACSEICPSHISTSLEP